MKRQTKESGRVTHLSAGNSFVKRFTKVIKLHDDAAGTSINRLELNIAKTSNIGCGPFFFDTLSNLLEEGSQQTSRNRKGGSTDVKYISTKSKVALVNTSFDVVS